MAGSDYFAYTVYVSLLTMLLTSLTMIDFPATGAELFGWGSEKTNRYIESKRSWTFLFMCTLTLFGFTSYIFSVQRFFDTTHEEGDYNGRFTYITALLGIVLAAVFVNTSYKISYTRQMVLHDTKVHGNTAEPHISETYTEGDSVSTTSIGASANVGSLAAKFKVHSELVTKLKKEWCMLFVNFILFVSFMIVTMVYIYTEPIDIVHNAYEPHTDAASGYLLASGILTVFTACFCIAKFNYKEGKIGYLGNDHAEKYLIPNMPLIADHVKAYGIPLNMSESTVKRKIDLSAMKEHEGTFNKIPFSASENIILPKNSVNNILYQRAVKKIRDDPISARQKGIPDEKSFSIRGIGGSYHAMSHGHTTEVDEYCNASELLAIKSPSIQTSSGIYARDKDYSKDRDLDLMLVDKQSIQAGHDNMYTQQTPVLIANLDYVANAYYVPITTKIFGFGEGIGIWMAFSTNVVVTFIVYLWPWYMYFLYNTLTGTMAWAITTWIPFLAATNGVFGQFWELFTVSFLSAWVIIIGSRSVLNENSLYIFDQERWNNTYIWSDEPTEGMVYNSTYLPEPENELDNSGTYFYACVLSFTIAAAAFVSQLTQFIAVYCTKPVEVLKDINPSGRMT